MFMGNVLNWSDCLKVHFKDSFLKKLYIKVYRITLKVNIVCQATHFQGSLCYIIISYTVKSFIDYPSKDFSFWKTCETAIEENKSTTEFLINYSIQKYEILRVSLCNTFLIWKLKLSLTTLNLGTWQNSSNV